MATFNNPVVDSGDAPVDIQSRGRVGFLATRPELDVVYQDYRTPNSLWAYYVATAGYMELYIVDPSGYKFLAVR